MSAPEPSDRAPLRKAGDAGLHPTAPSEPGTPAPGPDKLVKLTIFVPKSLRALLRAEADRRGMSIDEVVADALRRHRG